MAQVITNYSTYGGSFPTAICDTTSIAEFELKVGACKLGTLSFVAIDYNTFFNY